MVRKTLLTGLLALGLGAGAVAQPNDYMTLTRQHAVLCPLSKTDFQHVDSYYEQAMEYYRNNSNRVVGPQHMDKYKENVKVAMEDHLLIYAIPAWYGIQDKAIHNWSSHEEEANMDERFITLTLGGINVDFEVDNKKPYKILLNGEAQTGTILPTDKEGLEALTDMKPGIYIGTFANDNHNNVFKRSYIVNTEYDGAYVIDDQKEVGVLPLAINNHFLDSEVMLLHEVFNEDLIDKVITPEKQTIWQQQFPKEENKYTGYWEPGERIQYKRN